MGLGKANATWASSKGTRCTLLNQSSAKALRMRSINLGVFNVRSFIRKAKGAGFE